MLINHHIYSLDALQTWAAIIFIGSLVALHIQGKADKDNQND